MILNKKEFCYMVLAKHCEQENKTIQELSPMDALQSTSIGIAMEYLGLLDEYPDTLEYLSDRGGVVFTFPGKVPGVGQFEPRVMGMREILSLLPDGELELFKHSDN